MYKAKIVQKKYFVWLCSGLLSLIMCFNSCAHKSTVETLRIGVLNGPSAISMIQLIDTMKVFHHKQVEFVIVDEPFQIRNLIIDGQLDLATIPSVMACNLYNKDIPVKIAAIPVWGTLHLFGSDTTIKSWQDLKGKMVYLMAEGLTPDIAFRYLLMKNGLEPGTDVKLNYSFTSHIDLANAVIAGKADLGVLSEPLLSMVSIHNQSVKHLLDLNSEWLIASNYKTPFTQTALVSVGENIDLEMLKDFIAVYSDAANWVNQNPEEASVLIVKHKVLNDVNIAKKAIPGCNIKVIAASEIKGEILNFLNLFYHYNPRITGGQIATESLICCPKDDIK